MFMNRDKQCLLVVTVILLISKYCIASYLSLPHSYDNTYSDSYTYDNTDQLGFIQTPIIGDHYGNSIDADTIGGDNHIIDSNNGVVVVNPFTQEGYLKEGRPTEEQYLIPVLTYEPAPIEGYTFTSRLGYGEAPTNEFLHTSGLRNDYDVPINEHLPHTSLGHVGTVVDEYSFLPTNQHALEPSLIDTAAYSEQNLKELDQSLMSQAASMLMPHNPYARNGREYHQQQPVFHDPYGFRETHTKKKKRMKKKHKGYEMDKYHKDIDLDDYHDNHENDHYPKKKKTKYPKTKRKKKAKKVYVPIVVKKKKKKKRKTIAVYKGFYIPGGMQIFGKFKKIKDCKKACEITPNCFSADYNPWLKKCYIHTNVTACGNMRTHPKLIHFKKVPCDLLETPRGLILLGTRIHGGLEQKGIKNLQDCIKKCATAGQGIAKNSVPTEIAKQICFGVDYDFASHKCYFHTDMLLCPAVNPIPVPSRTVPAPSNILILICPLSLVTV